MPKLTCWTAIILSMGAIAYAGWLHATLENRVTATVEVQLRAREQLLVQRLRPQLEKLYQDFGTPSPRDPKTLEELIQPLIKLSGPLEKRATK